MQNQSTDREDLTRKRKTIGLLMTSVPPAWLVPIASVKFRDNGCRTRKKRWTWYRLSGFCSSTWSIFSSDSPVSDQVFRAMWIKFQPNSRRICATSGGGSCFTLRWVSHSLTCSLLGWSILFIAISICCEEACGVADNFVSGRQSVATTVDN